jgi:hypothetical protein
LEVVLLNQFRSSLAATAFNSFLARIASLQNLRSLN